MYMYMYYNQPSISSLFDKRHNLLHMICTIQTCMGMSQEGMHKANHLYRYTRCYNDILLYIGVLHLHYTQVIQYIIMIF